MIFAKLTLAFSMLMLTSSTLIAETWRIAALEWPPYASPDLPNDGIAVQVLRDILQTVDIDLHVEYMPWPRAQALARTGAYVGYFPAWPEEIKPGFIASEPIVTSVVGVIQRKEAPIDLGPIDTVFEDYRVGYVNTYVYPSPIQRQIDDPRNTGNGCDNERDLARKLSAGRVDLAITDPLVILHFAKDLGIEGLEAHPTTLFEKPLVLAFPNQFAFDSRREILNNLLLGRSKAN